MTAILERPYSYELVKAVSDVIGQVGEPGLEAAEIDWILSSIGVAARPVGYAKPDGLCVILFIAQLKDAGRLIAFITRAMNPARHVGNPSRFTALRRQLIEATALHGFTIDGTGRVVPQQSGILV